jgi:hypothetical protein
VKKFYQGTVWRCFSPDGGQALVPFMLGACQHAHFDPVSLAPGFSRVWDRSAFFNRFSGFYRSLNR